MESELEFLLLGFRVQSRMVDMVGSECRDLDLTPTEVVALLWLSGSSSPVSDVARAVGLHPNGASILLKRLQTRKLVKRQRSRRDQRVVMVSLTEAGRSLASLLDTRVRERLGPFLASFSASEREALVSSLRLLASA